ncbi:CotH kinase family protein [Olleya aquimaris]|uniref:CotH protein n=1 Tax=Olleya aquimaris TaxID=639310 RepID=A0A327RKW0_9FLAO|nr:CotH kinase family protein [Olleya aquimaris]RAJ16795.1 CotH protein [Olleya aquimaris]
MKHIIQVLFFVCFVPTFAQDIVAEEGSYGVDDTNKVIVWHTSNLDSVVTAHKTITSLKFDKIYTLEDASSNLSYTNQYKVSNSDSYTLFITKLPLIHITINTAKIDRFSKIPGYFTYYNKGEYKKSLMGVRHRGNLSLTFPKKSYDIEFWTDSISKNSKDLKFKGMRSDDDWILDGMFNEPLRLRSHISTKLWTKVHKPYYADKEPKAKSGFEVKYVEVFKNNQYYGLYQFSESVDRKQLQVKKHDKKTIYGELYKANSYDGGPDFTKAPKYNNLFPHWAGFRVEYPLIDYEADWKNLSDFVNLVVNGSDNDFINNIEKHVHIDNVIDYYLFINVVRATDNLGKNYYLGKYTTGEPYFFVAWDLDGVMGIIQDGKRENYTNDILGNGLFNRLIQLNPNNYNQKLKERWTALRANQFSNDNLLSKIETIYNRFTTENIYKREQLVWINKLNDTSNQDHFTYLNTWINKRMSHLDTYFNSL